MRVVNADVLILFGIYLSCWCCNEVLASGGALDSSQNYQTGSSNTPHSKLTSFSSTLTDGLAQAVAQESGMLLFSLPVSN